MFGNAVKPMSDLQTGLLRPLWRFPALLGSSLELFCPVRFKRHFRLLGFVWDGILYIKSASDRDCLWWRAFLPQRVAQKLRRINNEINSGVTLPTLSINGKCVVVAKTPSFFVISPSSTVIHIVRNNRKCIIPNNSDTLFGTVILRQISRSFQ